VPKGGIHNAMPLLPFDRGSVLRMRKSVYADN
jgi:hypothetical protein